jgi:hypothetical protein
MVGPEVLSTQVYSRIIAMAHDLLQGVGTGETLASWEEASYHVARGLTAQEAERLARLETP